jgi:hypothetical protein
MLGTNNSNDNDRVPRIKYCMDRKDNQGRSLADFYMNMYLENQDDPIYSDSISIRVLSQKFQWIEYDPEKEITRNKTILVNRLLDEARDQLGSVRCGKPVSKVSHSVENIPALFVLRGSNFMGFEDEVIKKMPRSRNFYEFNIEVSYEEMKTGTVYYPVYHFNPDLANLIPLDEETVETMQVFAEQIKQENDQIERAHRNAMEKRNLSDDAADAIEGVAYESLDDDLKDSE